MRTGSSEATSKFVSVDKVSAISFGSTPIARYLNIKKKSVSWSLRAILKRTLFEHGVYTWNGQWWCS